MKLVISTTFKPDGSATYTFRYIKPDKVTVSDMDASSLGIISADGHTGTCTGQTLISKFPNDVGQGTVNFINADGNFEATYNGKTQIVCVRQKNSN